MKAKMNKWSDWVDEARPDLLHGYYLDLLRRSGFTIINVQYHMFEPFGFTELILLGESHFAIHTFPEENRSYLELSSCIDGPFNRFMELLKEKEMPKTYDLEED